MQGIEHQRPDRRSTAQCEIGGRKETRPGVRVHSPGAGDRLEQFLWDNKEQPHEPARSKHEQVTALRDPGCRFLCVPKPPDFSCHRHAEGVEHAFPYSGRMAGSHLNYFDGFG